MANNNVWNPSRSSASKRAVNAACRQIGQEQGGTMMAATPYKAVEAGRGNPARDNAITNELIPPGPWGSNESGQPGSYRKHFTSEDNVSWEAADSQSFPW